MATSPTHPSAFEPPAAPLSPHSALSAQREQPLPAFDRAIPLPAGRLLTLADWRAAGLADLHAGAGSLARRLGALAAQLRQAPADPAWIHVATPQQVAEQAEALAARAAALPGRAALLREMPLFGVPFAAKDNIDVAGWPTTAACPAFAHVAAASATAVARLQAAGAVCVGKTNLDQFATGLVGTRSPYGRPASTFAADRVSGGSSSGSAVVVASGRLPFALGTDTAGSGRVPAGFNHIVGLKPTPGRVGTFGVVPACRSLDCVSVFALTVADAAQVLAVIEGADPADAYSDFAPGPAHWGSPVRPGAALAGQPRLRIGVPAAPRFGDTAGYAAAWQRAVAHLESLGHHVVTVDFAPLHAVAELLYGGPWVAERHASVRGLLARDPAAFDATVRQVIEAAFDYSATDAFVGQYTLQAARQAQAALWRTPGGRNGGVGGSDINGDSRSSGSASAGVDALMVPTAPAHPSFAEVDAEPLAANALLGHYTNFVNLLGWCALALPFGFAAAGDDGAAGALPNGSMAAGSAGAGAGLPFGVTFIAPANHDTALARFGIAWQDSLALTLGATGAPYRHENPTSDPTSDPPTWPASAPTLPLVVVGAHLSGLPLNGQLTERGAHFGCATVTAPHYRLFALPGTVPAKPGLLRVAADGAAIAVEVWEMPLAEVGGLLALIPPPLGLGSIELADGRWVHGFVCEAHALAAARDVTAFGGWRAFVQSLRAADVDSADTAAAPTAAAQPAPSAAVAAGPLPPFPAPRAEPAGAPESVTRSSA